MGIKRTSTKQRSCSVESSVKLQAADVFRAKGRQVTDKPPSTPTGFILMLLKKRTHWMFAFGTFMA